MDDGLKQRVIGAVLLLCLMVLFLPVLFDREDLAPIDRDTKIPESPNIQEITIPSAKEPLVESPAPDPQAMFIPDESTLVEVPVEDSDISSKQGADVKHQLDGKVKPVILDSQGVPNTWVLQVATFSEHQRAVTMRDEFIRQSYPAYIRKITLRGKPMTRVYVGPKLSRSLLLKTKVKIDKEYNLDSLLLRLNPDVP